VKLFHFEDLRKHVSNLETDDAESFFMSLLGACAIRNVPDDGRERVRIGADRKQSGTARENLVGGIFEVPDWLPDWLPDVQKRLVDFATPGLRAILGY